MLKRNRTKYVEGQHIAQPVLLLGAQKKALSKLRLSVYRKRCKQLELGFVGCLSFFNQECNGNDTLNQVKETFKINKKRNLFYVCGVTTILRNNKFRFIFCGQSVSQLCVSALVQGFFSQLRISFQAVEIFSFLKVLGLGVSRFF